MDYEKKYKEAIKKAKSKIKNDKDHVLYEDDIIDIFPELAESKDERIRKELIEYIRKTTCVNFIGKCSKKEAEKFISWLEKEGELVNSLSKGLDNAHERIDMLIQKNNSLIEQLENQGEQKLVDKVEPNFNVGDIISNGISEAKIVSIDKNYYIVTNDEIENDANVCNWVVYFKNQDDWKLIEQKPADKVKPKFKAGDWVVCNNGPHHIFQVIERSWPNAKYRNINGIEILLNVFTLDKQYHLWTIQDAKDGDVLYMDNGLSTCTFIYKSIDNVIIQKYASYNKFGFEGTTYLVLNDGYVCPATKEQRDLLFQKMKEAGYEWDAEKKELKKSESYSLRSIIKDEPSPAIKKVVDSLTAWGEEDKAMLNLIIARLHSHPNVDLEEYSKEYGWLKNKLKSLNGKIQPKQEWSKDDEKIYQSIMDDTVQENQLDEKQIDWIISLKGRIQSQLKQEWSEEDEVALGDALWCCKQAASIAKDENDMGNIWYAERWLNSLKDRVQPQPKQKWSEEDREYMESLLDIINGTSSLTPSEAECHKDWLKSLKDRYAWKPSNEQMEGIECTIKTLRYQLNAGDNRLDSLYNDLKKLRGE